MTSFGTTSSTNSILDEEWSFAPLLQSAILDRVNDYGAVLTPHASEFRISDALHVTISYYHDENSFGEHLLRELPAFAVIVFEHQNENSDTVYASMPVFSIREYVAAGGHLVVTPWGSEPALNFIQDVFAWEGVQGICRHGVVRVSAASYGFDAASNPHYVPMIQMVYKTMSKVFF